MLGSQGEKGSKATGTEAREGGPDEASLRQEKTGRAAKVMHEHDFSSRFNMWSRYFLEYFRGIRVVMHLKFLHGTENRTHRMV